MREFKINDYITLKLEDGKTNIYVNNELFRQCKFLLLNIPIKRAEDFEGISSIDEAEEQLDGSMEDSNGEIKIPDRAEFWAHCSNLQVWYENQYDSRLLHRNLAFPLLKKLSEAGDLLAKKVFKEEIMKRLSSNHPTIVNYLFKERFTDNLNREDIITSLINPQEAEVIIELEHLLGSEFLITNSVEVIKGQKTVTGIQEKKVISIQIAIFLEEFKDLSEGIYENIRRLKHLKHLYLNNNDFIHLPEWICKLKSLETLDISSCELESLPECIGNLKSLKDLNLFYNYLEELPSSIGKLTNLINLILSNNWLRTLPISIGTLKKLKHCDIDDNKLQAVPRELGNLPNLETLSLYLNRLQSLPDSLQNLHKLKKIDLRGNFFQMIPEYLLDLPNIKELKADTSLIRKINKNKLDQLKLKKIDIS